MMNPQKLTALVKQGSSHLVATSRDVLRRLDPGAPLDATDLNTYDESILQQSRFWMRTVTWTLIGTSVFGIAWFALARTEEIVVAPGQLEPIGSVQDIQMPLGGVADQILVSEGDTVKAGQVLMKLDTEASEEQRRSLEKTIELKQEQLKLKEIEKRNSIQVNQEQVLMLENNLALQSEILTRFEQLEQAGAASELQYLNQQNAVAEIRGKLMQSRADRLRQIALLDQQTAQLKSELVDLNGRVRSVAGIGKNFQLLKKQTSKDDDKLLFRKWIKLLAKSTLGGKGQKQGQFVQAAGLTVDNAGNFLGQWFYLNFFQRLLFQTLKSNFYEYEMEFKKVVNNLIKELSGSISAEHGIGLLKRDDFLETKNKLEIELMKNIKKIFDPKNILNQNKIFKL